MLQPSPFGQLGAITVVLFVCLVLLEAEPSRSASPLGGNTGEASWEWGLWDLKGQAGLIAKSSFWLELEEFLRRNYFLVVFSWQSKSKLKNVLKNRPLKRKNRLFQSNFFWSRLWKTASPPSVIPTTFPTPNPSGDEGHIHSAGPVGACPTAACPRDGWWQLRSAASVLKGLLTQSAASPHTQES